MRILVGADERPLTASVVRVLSADGHTVEVAHDGPAAEHLALAGGVDLALLEVTLPRRDGLTVLQAIRARKPALPVIMLSACDDAAARVRGLDLGADDYLTGPFCLDELRARVRAQLRGPRQAHAARLVVGDLSVDLCTRRTLRQERPVDLTAKEYALLTYLMRHPDQVLSREQLLQAVWGLDFVPRTKVLDVYIGYLRRKLALPGQPDPIETVRQVGYRLCISHPDRAARRPR